MTYDRQAPRAPRLKPNRVTTKMLLGLTHDDELALDALLAKGADATTVSRSTLIRHAIKCYARHAKSLRGSALSRELQEVNKGTYADA